MHRTSRALAILLWVFACVSCGSDAERQRTGKSSDAIINGTPITSAAEVEARKVVYIRAVQTQGGLEITCVKGSGTLLSNNWVLTAAHVGTWRSSDTSISSAKSIGNSRSMHSS